MGTKEFSAQERIWIAKGGVNPEDWPTPQVMAHTVWGEARGENDIQRIAVASVIWNRATNPRWWGTDVKSVCLAPWQFSCWNRKDPNRQKLIDLDIDNGVYQRIYDICLHVMNGKIEDPTSNSDHYLRSELIERTHWAKNNPDKFVRKIGPHSFYRLELSPPPPKVLKLKPKGTE